MTDAAEAPVCRITPEIYAHWRASRLGQITDQLEHDLLADHLPPVQGKRVLDVGCGDGELTLWLDQQGALAVGADADPDMLDAARRRFEDAGAELELHQAPAHALPFADNSFDVVTAITILCFIRNAEPDFREIARVLRPGGQFVIGELGRYSIWAAWRRLRAWFGSELWRAAYFRSPGELARLAQEAGLRVKTVEGGIFYPPIGWAAKLMAPIDRWLGRHITLGAAFLLLVAEKPGETAG